MLPLRTDLLKLWFIEEQELYIAPLMVSYVIYPEGILCESDDSNMEDPDEDGIIEW